MNHLQRVSYILGTMLLGVSALILWGDYNRRHRPPVAKLAEDLKSAWAPYHTP